MRAIEAARENERRPQRSAGAADGTSLVAIFNTKPRCVRMARGNNEKAPREWRWGLKTAPFLAKGAIPAAWEGGLAYGLEADYSGGTAAELHGLPRFPCLQK